MPKIVGDDGNPLTPAQEEAYIRSRERGIIGGWASSALAWAWGAAKIVAPMAFVAFMASVLTVFFLGHLTLPTGGCNPPAPAPTPPNPPNPAPTDPLTQALQAAYNADSDPAKADKLAGLADYYGAVIAALKTDSSITTVAQLQARIHAGGDVAAGTGGMPSLRKAVAAYVAPKLPSTDEPLTPAILTTAAAAYSAISTALKGVK